MKMIQMPPIGLFGVNSYIIYDERGNAAVIDAPGDADKVMKVLEENGLKLKLILLTHGHCDHIAGLKELQDKTGAEVYIHEKDEKKLCDSDANLVNFFSLPDIPKIEKANLLSDESVKIKLGDDAEISFIHTPGHTSGGVCFIADDMMFTGDTLFAGSMGRTDMPDGNTCTLNHALRKVEGYKGDYDDYRIYPGHGPSSTLSYERKHNEFINYFHITEADCINLQDGEE